MKKAYLCKQEKPSLGVTLARPTHLACDILANRKPAQAFQLCLPFGYPCPSSPLLECLQDETLANSGVVYIGHRCDEAPHRQGDLSTSHVPRPGKRPGDEGWKSPDWSYCASQHGCAQRRAHSGAHRAGHAKHKCTDTELVTRPSEQAQMHSEAQLHCPVNTGHLKYLFLSVTR